MSWAHKLCERGDQRTLVSPEDRSLHLPGRHDELLAQKDILRGRLDPRTEQISRQVTGDRAPPRTQRFADSRHGVAEDRAQPGDDSDTHETDPGRDEQQLQALATLANRQRSCRGAAW
jgi:hypothetical protein